MYNRKFKARPKGKNGPRQSFFITYGDLTTAVKEASQKDKELKLLFNF